MEINIKKTVEETKTLNLPLFFIENDGSKYVGVFSETDLRLISNNTKWSGTFMLNKVDMTKTSMWSDWDKWLNPEQFTPISEQEFIATWDNTLRSLSFNALAEPIPY